MKTTVICSVGISLFPNLKRMEIEWKEKDTDKVVEDILKHEDHAKASAEITSVNSLLRDNVLDSQKNLYFLLSETPDTEEAGRILKAYFSSKFEHVHLITIKGLSTKDPTVFKEEGLRELVKATSQIIYNARQKQEECVINATGGYKAQISFLELVGQVLKVDVYYQFEGFDTVIKLPRLPISFDFHIWIRYFPYLNKLYNYGSLPEHELENVKEELKDFTDEAEGQYRLSSTGILIHETLLERFRLEGENYLPTVRGESEKAFIATYGTDIPLSLQTMMENIGRLDYVTSLDIKEFKQDFPGRTVFKVNGLELTGTYSDHRHTWIFNITTTAKDELESHAVCVDLNLRYSNPFEKPEPKPVEFVIVRHGHHIGEEENRIEGWADFPLSELGMEQSRLVANRIKKEFNIDALYASSLQRAQQTAEIIGKEIDKKPVVLKGLKAMNYGEVGGLMKEEAKIRFPVARDRNFLHNKAWGSESLIEFNQRVIEAFYQIYYTHPGETVVLVTHGSAIDVIFKEMLDLPVNRQFYVNTKDTSIHHFTFGPQQTIVHDLNNAEHLNDKEAERL